MGSGLARHWLYRLLFLDALQYLSNGLITFSLTRYILVDIDDIFVGSNRLTKNDVQALIESQDILITLIPGFQYNLGTWPMSSLHNVNKQLSFFKNVNKQLPFFKNVNNQLSLFKNVNKQLLFFSKNKQTADFSLNMDHVPVFKITVVEISLHHWGDNCL